MEVTLGKVSVAVSKNDSDVPVAETRFTRWSRVWKPGCRDTTVSTPMRSASPVKGN